jgi:hypothetical protein
MDILDERLEVFERRRLMLHLQAEPGHEDEVRMRAERHQPVALERTQRLARLIVELKSGITASRSAAHRATNAGSDLSIGPTRGLIDGTSILSTPALHAVLPAPGTGGLSSLEDIDQAMKLGCGYPMKPFTLLDLVGLDTTMFVAEVMFEEFREPRYAPPPLLKRMVMAGHLGRKTGRGFYRY